MFNQVQCVETEQQTTMRNSIQPRNAYVAGGHAELGVVEGYGLRRDVHAEEAARVAEGEPDRGVDRGQIRRHQRRVRARLDHEVVEGDALFDHRTERKSSVQFSSVQQQAS
jgi:surfactin synthase thioesterase subunit